MQKIVSRYLGSLQLKRPPHRLDRAPDVLVRLEHTRTPRTAGLLALAFTRVGILDDRLGDAPGEGLTHPPHGVASLGESGWGFTELLCAGIEPLLKALLELLAKRVPVFACPNVGSGENLSTSHG